MSVNPTVSVERSIFVVEEFEKGIQCAICIKDFKNGDPLSLHASSENYGAHTFHSYCLSSWFKFCSTTKKTCPLCRILLQAAPEPDATSTSKMEELELRFERWLAYEERVYEMMDNKKSQKSRSYK